MFNFYAATFCLDARVQTSLPLPVGRVNHSLVKAVPCRHNALMQLANIFGLIDLSVHHRSHCVVHWTRDSSPDCLVASMWAEWSLVSWLSVTSPMCQHTVLLKKMKYHTVYELSAEDLAAVMYPCSTVCWPSRWAPQSKYSFCKVPTCQQRPWVHDWMSNMSAAGTSFLHMPSRAYTRK